MTNKITNFPKWNPRSTIPERLREVAIMAEQNPELFNKLIIGWLGETDGGFRVNYAVAGGGMTTLEAHGLIRLMQIELERVTS